MIRPPKLRRMTRCTQHFQQVGLTWLTQWSNLTSLWYGQFSLSLGKAPIFPLQSYTLKWGPVRAGAQLIRVNSDKQHGRGTATLEEKWWQDRVIKNREYEIRDQQQKNGVGSGITAPGSGSTSRGIGISITVRRSGIRSERRLAPILIGARKTQVFWHLSEVRTAATVWNWSGKTLSPGALLAVVYFFRAIFFRPFRLALTPLSAPGSPRMCRWKIERLKKKFSPVIPEAEFKTFPAPCL